MYKQACMCGSYKALWHTFLWCLRDFTSSAISSTILVNTANCSSSHNFKFSNCACIEHSHPTEVPYMIACAIIILKNTIMYVYTHMQTYTHTTLLVRSLSCGVDCPCCLGIEDDASSGSPTSERYPSPRKGRDYQQEQTLWVVIVVVTSQVMTSTHPAAVLSLGCSLLLPSSCMAY